MNKKQIINILNEFVSEIHELINISFFILINNTWYLREHDTSHVYEVIKTLKITC